MYFSTKETVDIQTFQSFAQETIKMLTQLGETQLRQGSELRSLRDAIVDLNTRMAEMNNILSNLSRQMSSMSSDRMNQPAVTIEQVYKPTPNTEIHPAPMQEKKREETAKETSRTFFGNYSPRKGVLQELSEAFRNSAPFVATVKGDTGTVAFNKDCRAEALRSLSSIIFPFFNYDLQSQTPSEIIPQNTVKIKRRSANEWEMDGQISLIIR